MEGWRFLQVAEGIGYWRQEGVACELAGGSLLLAAPGVVGGLHASRLGEVRLRWFSVRPELLTGVISFEEQRACELAARTSAPRHYSTDHPLAESCQKLFADETACPLLRRARMLGLLAQALAPEFAEMPDPAVPADARVRLRQWLTQAPEAELLTHSVETFARELHCSERHFSRLFHEEVGVSFREKQTELRLLKARHLLAGSNEKIIHVALESGYRHLGLFNALFKRRFGMTPTRWRRQSLASAEGRRRVLPGLARHLISAVVCLSLLPLAWGAEPAATNAPAGPVFRIDRYDVQGNTLLPADVVQTVLTDFTGEKVGFETIRQAVTALQLAYRGRGWATVSLGLPPQQITNGVVKVQVTEGRIVDINIVGNRWFGTNNVRRALPGLTTNGFLNSRLFQADLDLANNNRDRQIYPQIQPGPEPGTSVLLLKVKDQLPLHGRFDLNNQATPGTPELRGSASVQYNNLWQLEHSFGLQYGFALQQFKNYTSGWNIFDRPAIANYSTFYRVPLGAQKSAAEQVEADPRRFGYNEVTHQFNLPPASGRSELNFYASRSTTDTGLKFGSVTTINPPPIALYSQDSGQDVSTTESVGFRWSLPLPAVKGVNSTLSLGADLKHFFSGSFNTNNFTEDFTIHDPTLGDRHQIIPFTSAQPARLRWVNYLPVALRWDGSRADKTGSTTLGAGVNMNFAGGPFSDTREFQQLASGDGNYVTAQFSASREQTLYEEWTLLLRADGQWSNQGLISNEQFGLGGTAGVRGYREGERYGSSGWRATLEPRTPMLDIGMVDGTAPMRVRASAFMDYGQSYLYSVGLNQTEQLWGAGLGFSGTIGTTFDFRLAVAWALHTAAQSRPGDLQIYFGVGAQF